MTFSPPRAHVEGLGSRPALLPTHRAPWASPSVFSTVKPGFLASAWPHPASRMLSGSRSKSNRPEHVGVVPSQQSAGGRMQIRRPWMLHSAHHPTQVQPDMKSIPGAGFRSESPQSSCSAEQDWTREGKRRPHLLQALQGSFPPP